MIEQGFLAHRAALNDCYALNEKELEISIRTGYEVERVFICYGDPFSAGIMGGAEQWSGEKKEISDSKNLANQKLWTVKLTPQYRRCKYFFELWSDEEVLYYFEDGCYTKERMEMPGRNLQCFFFPWMNPADINETPDWVKDTIWYQIFPDRFCNGDASLNSEWVKQWKCEPVQHLDIYGGDLRGIRSRIAYLQELGITGIYLTPIFSAKSNHKYNTTDYYKIDEYFGDEEELRKLVQDAHKAGIRVMLDAVFNHCGDAFAPWQDVLEKGPESVYYDWFFIHQWPFDRQNHNTRDGKYDAFAFYGSMPKLNTNNPEVIAYFKQLCTYWLTEWKIDGIRFDVGNEVSHAFLKELRKQLKAVNPEVYLLGEIWHDSINWLMGDEYDSVMNYPLAQSLNDFFIDETRTAEDFECAINRCYSIYMKQTNRVLFNLLDSHDTERLSTRTKTIGRFYQQLALLFTMEGSPCIYYGTEIVMPGGFDPDCRRCMPWEEIEKGSLDMEIGRMKQLIALRKQYPQCRAAGIRWEKLEQSERMIHYVKYMEGEPELHVILNAGREVVQIPAQGEVLFACGLSEDGSLEPDGCCIRIKRK